MKSWFLVSILIFASSVLAHENHDWRYDITAYLNINYQGPLFSKARKKSVSISAPKIDMAYFKSTLMKFASFERSTNQGLDKARALLKEEYEKIGYVVSFQPFGLGTNFIAEKIGSITPNKVLILSSHIDSFQNFGANDNGTGTIGLLTMARALSTKNFSSTIRILGFDREEDGLWGSDAYTVTLNTKDVLGNINFEMMGYHSRGDNVFHVIDCGRLDSIYLSESIKKSIQNLDLGLTIAKTCTYRSDHASFWRRNMPAVVISENFFGGDADPCYHDSCDVVDERLNFPYMEKILLAVLGATENVLK